MRFNQVSRYCQLSDCGKYSVAAYREPVGDAWVYQTWRVKDRAILWTGAAELCRQAAHDDSEGVNTAAECYQPALVGGEG